MNIHLLGLNILSYLFTCNQHSSVLSGHIQFYFQLHKQSLLGTTGRSEVLPSDMVIKKIFGKGAENRKCLSEQEMHLGLKR